MLRPSGSGIYETRRFVIFVRRASSNEQRDEYRDSRERGTGALRSVRPARRRPVASPPNVHAHVCIHIGIHRVCVGGLFFVATLLARVLICVQTDASGRVLPPTGPDGMGQNCNGVEWREERREGGERGVNGEEWLADEVWLYSVQSCRRVC